MRLFLLTIATCLMAAAPSWAQLNPLGNLGAGDQPLELESDEGLELHQDRQMMVAAFEQRLVERCRLQHARRTSRDRNLPLKLPVAFDGFTQLRQSRERSRKQIATQEEVEECRVVVTQRPGLPVANRALQSVDITQGQFVGG